MRIGPICLTAVLSLSLPLVSNAFPDGQSAHASGATAVQEASKAAITGRVSTVLHAGTYTYVEIETPDDKRWVAAPAVDVRVGEDVKVPPGMAMREFPSKALDRTFDLVYFVSRVGLLSERADEPEPAGDAPHPTVKNDFDVTEFDFSQLKRPKKGARIGKILAKPSRFSGREVVIRAVVVKVNADIMKLNWIHLRDGSGGKKNTLIATTSAMAKPGDVVLVKGTVVTDKDFGYGYKYAVLLENAKFLSDKPKTQAAPIGETSGE